MDKLCTNAEVSDLIKPPQCLQTIDWHQEWPRVRIYVERSVCLCLRINSLSASELKLTTFCISLSTHQDQRRYWLQLMMGKRENEGVGVIIWNYIMERESLIFIQMVMVGVKAEYYIYTHIKKNNRNKFDSSN